MGVRKCRRQPTREGRTEAAVEDGRGSGSSWKGHQRARATAKSQRTAVDARSLHPYSRRGSLVRLVFLDLPTAFTLAYASSALR